MPVIGASLLVGLVGALVSRAWTRRLASRGVARDPHVDWVLGLLGLTPAWLVAFLALLGPTPARRLQGAAEATWILAAAAALLGAIVTEARVRAEPEREWTARWWYGLAALAPAWIISLLGHVL
jgi:hypothetical protein